MNKKIILAPSILSCDFYAAGEQIETAYEAGAEYLHLDVMDGVFVPNISIGVPVVKSLRKKCKAVFDVHLMITEPHRYIEAFAKAGADIITIHLEAESDVSGCLKEIRRLGAKPAISVKPKTKAEELFPYLELCDMALVMTVEPGFGGQSFMADMAEKCSILRDYREKNNLDFDIEVDGGVDANTAPVCVKAGANVLVAGSSVFCKPDVKKACFDILHSVE